MADESYRIVFRGELVAGVSRTTAEANLKTRFKYSDAALAKLFSGKGVVLKSDLDQATAEKYEKALAGVGLVCEVLPVATDRPSFAPEPEPAPAAETASPEPAAPVEAVAAPEPQPEPVVAAETTEQPEPEPVPAAIAEEEDIFASTEESMAAGSAEDEDWGTAGSVVASAEEEEDIFAPAQDAAPVAEVEDEGWEAATDESAAAEEDEDIFAPAAEAQEAAAAGEEDWQPAPEEAAGPSQDEDVFVPVAETEDALSEEAPAAGPVGLAVLDILRQTKPWVRLISVLLFVSSGLGLLAMLGLLLGGMLGGMGFQSDTPTLLMFVVQMLSLLLYLIPAYFLFKYASAIGVLLKGGGESELETALAYQKSFWRFSGILALITLGLVALGIVAAVLIPFTM